MRTLTFAAAIVAMGLVSPAIAADPPATAPSADIPTARLDSPFDLSGRVNGMIAQRQEDPIKTIVIDMGGATDLLTRFNTSEPVQPQQKAIIGQLDELIAMLEEQMKKVSGGTNLNPSSPLPDSAVIRGRLRIGPMNDPASSTRLWGQLPPRQREQILQSQNEGFPAGYQSILSSYYRRLAQENVTGGDSPEAPSQPAPAAP